MASLNRLLSWVIHGVTVLSGLVIALMMVHIALDVVLRNFFNYPLPATITVVSYYYMAIAAFMPLALAEQRNAHISVEVLTEHLPAAVQKHLAGWLLLLSAVVFALLTVCSWNEAMGKYVTSASVVQGESSLAVWPTYFFLPLGCGLMLLMVVLKFLAYITGRPLAVEAPVADAFSDQPTHKG